MRSSSWSIMYQVCYPSYFWNQVCFNRQILYLYFICDTVVPLACLWGPYVIKISLTLFLKFPLPSPSASFLSLNLWLLGPLNQGPLDRQTLLTSVCCLRSRWCWLGTTVLDAVKAAVFTTTQVIHEASPTAEVAAKTKADFAIVVVGEQPYAEGAGDNTNLTIPDEGISTIKNVCSEVKCLVILISGRPLVVEPYLPLMEAFVAAWLPGTEGNGVTDVIFGDYDFVGSLSRTWFKSADQLPMNFGDPIYDPLFRFAFGLGMGKLPRWNRMAGLFYVQMLRRVLFAVHNCCSSHSPLVTSYVQA